jgi:polyhydroxyalkanoate synthesis regulator phasin
MLDIIKKSIYLGLGIATVTKEKVESLVDELIEKGQLAKEDKSKAVQEILNKLEKSETEFKKKTIAVVDEAVNSLESSTQKDIEELKKIVSDLDKKINAN